MMRRTTAAIAVAAALTSCSSQAPRATRVTLPPTPAQTSVPTPAATAARPTAVPATAAPQPSPCSGPGCFDLGRAMAHVRALSIDIGVRRAGEDGDRRAADYIAAEIQKLGVAARLQPFNLPESGAETRNVVADEGVDTAAGSYLIVGAHYDTTSTSPGANDNATGVAVMIEAIRALKAVPARVPVVFVAFGAEEVQPGPKGTHHLGSRHWVGSMSEGAKRNLLAAYSVDMVGFGKDIVCGRMSSGPREATQRLLRVAREIGVPARERVTPDWSDNGPFLRAGLNAGWVWSGEDRRYHSPRDTFDHVQPESVDRAGRLLLAAVRSYP